MANSLVFLMKCLAILVISSAAPTSDFSGVLSQLYRGALKAHKPLVLVLDRSNSNNRLSSKKHQHRSESTNDVFADVVVLLSQLQRKGSQSLSLSQQQNQLLSLVSNLLSHSSHSQSSSDRLHRQLFHQSSRAESQNKRQLAEAVNNILKLTQRLDHQRKSKPQHFKSRQSSLKEDDNEQQSQVLSLFRSEQPELVEEDDNQKSQVLSQFRNEDEESQQSQSSFREERQKSLEERDNQQTQVFSLLKGLSQPGSLEEDERSQSVNKDYPTLSFEEQQSQYLLKSEKPLQLTLEADDAKQGKSQVINLLAAVKPATLEDKPHTGSALLKDDLNKQKLVKKVLNLLRAEEKPAQVADEQTQNVKNVLNTLQNPAPKKKSEKSLVKSLLALRNSLRCGQRDSCQKQCPSKGKKKDKCEDRCEEDFDCEEEEEEEEEECEGDQCEADGDSCEGDDGCEEDQEGSTKGPPEYDEPNKSCKRC